jgi:hypothetical protein
VVGVNVLDAEVDAAQFLVETTVVSFDRCLTIFLSAVKADKKNDI